MSFESFGISDLGLHRHNNEDRFLVRDDLGLYVVADGMGGHAAGEVAAELAVREIERAIAATDAPGAGDVPGAVAADPERNRNRAVQAVLAAHREIAAASSADSGLRSMGTTIVMSLIDWESGRVTLAHVGDSRAYLVREGGMRLLTADHSWVAEQVRSGALSEDAARAHPLKNVLTRSLGGAADPDVDVADHTLAPGDQLLLCSDGLSTMLADDEIRAVLVGGAALATVARQLTAEANRRGGVDNITVVLVRT